MPAEKCITRIQLNDGDVFLVAENESNFNNLRIKILNVTEKEAYVGLASNIDLRSQAASIRLSFDDFMEKAKCALFQHESNHSNFRYSLNKKHGTGVFIWKSIDSEETIINLGSIEMKKRDFGVLLSEVLLSLAEEMQSLKNNYHQVSKELDFKNLQTTTALALVAKANTLLLGLQKEIYSKFTVVLNEKKRKIKELESGSDSSSNEISAAKRKPAKVLTDSSSESEVDGELEIHKPGPSNAAKRNSLPFYEVCTCVPQSKIRNRKAAVNKNNNDIPDPPTVSVPAECDNGIEDSGSADSLMEFL